MPKKEKKASKWFKGNVFAMPSSDLQKVMKHEKGIMKPTAMRTKTIKGKIHSQFYHKPVQPGEFWD